MDGSCEGLGCFREREMVVFMIGLTLSCALIYVGCQWNGMLGSVSCVKHTCTGELFGETFYFSAVV